MVTTVTTITTITTIATLGISAFISIAAIAALVIFLVTRELAVSSNSPVSTRIAKFASVGILPLVIAFAIVVIVKIIEVL
ncbi:hypothetical protein ACFLTB_02280 [Chloroflexota bacterium]